MLRPGFLVLELLAELRFGWNFMWSGLGAEAVKDAPDTIHSLLALSSPTECLNLQWHQVCTAASLQTSVFMPCLLCCGRPWGAAYAVIGFCRE